MHQHEDGPTALGKGDNESRHTHVALHKNSESFTVRTNCASSYPLTHLIRPKHAHRLMPP